MSNYVLEMRNITKQFSGVKALDDITFKVRKGEIHALLGENGAGKSTLMKVLCGLYPYGTYGGSLFLDGKEQKFGGIRDSENAGISIIYQELGVIRNMTVCENIFLGNEIKKGGLIDWKAQKKKTRELLDRLSLNAEPDTIVGNLGVGQQQLVEIAKAINKDIKVLILDEPTSSLTEADTEKLFKVLNELRADGVTSIFITHKLYEAMEMADNITIIRDGKAIISVAAREITEDSIVSYMVGREITDRFPREEHTAGETVLEVKNWNAPDLERPGRMLFDDINIMARKGEILGIAGLMGAGRTEFALSLFGALEQPVTGEVYMDGKKLNIKTPHQAIEAGLCYVSEDRKRYGLVLTSDIKTNMTLSSLENVAKHGVLDQDQEKQLVSQYIEKLHVKTPSMFQIVANLSGGNQQKVVLAKALLSHPKVLILDEPTRGIDVGSKYEIYQLMNQLVNEGVSIIMISSELPEVLNMSDRICVMHEGKITAELENKEKIITQEEILFYAAGGAKGGNEEE